MENWGLIVHRSTRILCSESETSFKNKAEIALTIAHELAHQVNSSIFAILNSHAFGMDS